MHGGCQPVWFAPSIACNPSSFTKLPFFKQERESICISSTLFIQNLITYLSESPHLVKNSIYIVHNLIMKISMNSQTSANDGTKHFLSFGTEGDAFNCWLCQMCANSCYTCKTGWPTIVGSWELITTQPHQGLKNWWPTTSLLQLIPSPTNNFRPVSKGNKGSLNWGNTAVSLILMALIC